MIAQKKSIRQIIVISENFHGPMMEDGSHMQNFESEFNYSSIYIYDTQTEQITRVTHEEVHDYSPCFDPKGRYLYFLSKRVFNPYEDSLQNDYNFPATARPYLVVLESSEYSPFSFAGLWI